MTKLFNSCLGVFRLQFNSLFSRHLPLHPFITKAASSRPAYLFIASLTHCTSLPRPLRAKFWLRLRWTPEVEVSTQLHPLNQQPHQALPDHSHMAHLPVSSLYSLTYLSIQPSISSSLLPWPSSIFELVIQVVKLQPSSASHHGKSCSSTPLFAS